LGMFAMGAAMMLPRPAISTGLLAGGLLLAAAIAGATAWIIMAPPAAVMALLARLPLRFRRRLQVLARQLSDALARFHAYPDVMAQGFGLSVVLQSGVVVMYGLFGAALGFEVPAA